LTFGALLVASSQKIRYPVLAAFGGTSSLSGCLSQWLDREDGNGIRMALSELLVPWYALRRGSSRMIGRRWQELELLHLGIVPLALAVQAVVEFLSRDQGARDGAIATAPHLVILRRELLVGVRGASCHLSQCGLRATGRLFALVPL
jgi:hypothetical protein